MSARKIKNKSSRKPRLHGHRQHQHLNRMERHQQDQRNRETARRSALTRVDTDTGETYVLSTVRLSTQKDVEAYQQALSEIMDTTRFNSDEQAEEIRKFTQSWIDEGRLVAVDCRRGVTPSVRVYQGKNERVVAIKQSQLNEHG